MNRLFYILCTLVMTAGSVYAGENPEHSVPTLKSQAKTTVTTQGNTLTVTFGPIDLPAGHSGDLAASMPKHIFELPKDRYLVGYKTAVFTREGTPLPQEYLHHILLISVDQPSVSCPGEPLFFAGAGMEMMETRFPKGYGVKLEKGKKLMSIVAFYHKVPPTKNVMATFTMEMAPEGEPIQAMDVYQVGVNVVCYSKFKDRPKNETDEGIKISSSVQVFSAPLKFLMDGCVKFAYPHGHDQLLLITLDDKTHLKTLLRTVPNVSQKGSLINFQHHQVYQDEKGFSVNTQDEYEMTMVYHRPLEDSRDHYGMGNYLLYMTPGVCNHTEMASAK